MSDHQARAARRRRWTLIVVAVLLLPLPSLLGGCAYFNAFYNTQHHYQQGERERERSPDQDARPAAYEQAVDAGGRLLEFHPESDYVDDALFIMGKSYYWLGDYHKARRKFLELQSNYPDSPHITESRLWLGRSMVGLKMRSEATRTLQELINQTDDPELIGGSVYALGELYYDDSLFVEAAEEFAQVTETEASSRLIGESHWRAGEAYFREGDYHSAVEHLKEAKRYELTRSLTFRVLLAYGEALRLTGQTAEAIDEFQVLLADKRYFDNHGRVRVHLGLALADLGQDAEAIKQFDEVVETHGRTPEAARALYHKGMILLSKPDARREAKEVIDVARAEKAGSLYSLKADTMLQLLNRVDQLGTDRADILRRIELTSSWIANPVRPSDSTAFRQTSYYDSAAIDTLRLAPLWSMAWSDSIFQVDGPKTGAGPDAAGSAGGESDSAASEAARQEEAARKLSEAPDADTSGIASDSLRPQQSLAPDLQGIASDSTEQLDGRPGTGDEEAVQLEPDTLQASPDSSEIKGARWIDDSGETVRGVQPSAGLHSPQMQTMPGLIADAFGTGVQSRDSLAGPKAQRSGGDVLAERPTPQPTAPLPDSVQYDTVTHFDSRPVADSLGLMRGTLKEIRFQLAEILLLELNQPDSARIVLHELAEPANPDSVRARSLLALAWISERQGQPQQQDSLLSILAERYPANRFGRYAARELGQQPALLTDPAEEAFNEAESLFTHGSPEQAYTRYRLLMETHPQTRWAPMAMFAAAYIAGQYLDDGESAEELFNDLATRYPDSRQARQADVILGELQRRRQQGGAVDSVDLAEEFADIDAYGQDAVDEQPRIVGGVESLASVLDSRGLLPQEVIQGTGGDVLLRYIVDEEGAASSFRVVLENPIGLGLGRGLIQGLETVTFQPGILDGERVAVRVERRFTLPLDAPPNIRPLPRRNRS